MTQPVQSGETRRFGQVLLLALGALAMASATSGCFVETNNSPPPPTCLDGAVAAEWTLTANGQAVACAPGDGASLA